ncbi:MAG: hypothetical protein AAF600_14500 [Bacteroidota bacterium]
MTTKNKWYFLAITFIGYGLLLIVFFFTLRNIYSRLPDIEIYLYQYILLNTAIFTFIFNLFKDCYIQSTLKSRIQHSLYLFLTFLLVSSLSTSLLYTLHYLSYQDDHYLKYVMPALLTIIIAFLYFTNKPSYSYYKTKTIPDTNLQVVIYLQNNFRTLSLTGESSYQMAYVELQDLAGNILAKQNFFNRCEFQLGEMYLGIADNKLYLTKFSYIDLENYNYYCFK